MAITLIKRSLAQHEEIIESCVKSFLDVGRSLMAIRDDELYRTATDGKYETFESYCSKRWGFAKTRAYQLIESAITVSDLSTIVDKRAQILPENEGQARAVADSAPDAKTRATIWKAAVESAPKDESGNPKVTAAIVKKAAESLGVTKPPRNKPATRAPKNDAAHPLPIPEREPGDEPPEPEHDDGITDELGNVSPKLRKVFAEVSTFNGIQQRLGKLKSDIEELQRSDAGAAIAINEVLKDLKSIQQAVKFAIPYTECPKCRRKKNEDCKTCSGVMWITEATWNRCKTKEDEQWLTSR